MITRIVKLSTCFSIVSAALVSFGACASQVAPEQSPTIQESEIISQIEQGLQGPNCANGVGSPSARQAIISAGRDCGGNPLGECRIGDFYINWDCVRMPNGQIVPQNIRTSTEFCRCDRGFTCC